MSMYELTCNQNPNRKLLLEMLDLSLSAPDVAKQVIERFGSNEDELSTVGRATFDLLIETFVDEGCFYVGRFRDAHLEEDGKVIAIYTRNGGGNRGWLWWAWEILRKHPQYISDKDDEFDSTYATIRFRTPEEHLSKTSELAKDPEMCKSGTQKLDEVLRICEHGTDEEKRELGDKMKPVAEKLKKALDGEGPRIIEV